MESICDDTIGGMNPVEQLLSKPPVFSEVTGLDVLIPFRGNREL